ncbi:MAG: uroporphyrinogen-III C-methyltransferase [Thermodesulfobacteriota bacterium]
MAKKKSMLKGKVYLVGAGPGDPELITVKGGRLLREAQCIIYDFLASSRLLAYAGEGVETIYVGKKGSVKSISQPEITALIIERAKKGKTVVRLKGGDPFIFGRGAEEAEALVKAKIPFEIVPGVTSAIAAPSYAGIPLTHRDLSSSVTFITGQESPLKERKNIAWDRLSTGRGTLVFLMGWKNLPLITGKLLKNGWPEKTPVALIRWGTLPVQKVATGTLKTIVEVSRKEEIKPPVITVVGDVVRLREDFNWFETKPLFGRTIVVTRAEEQAGEFTGVLEKYGAIPLGFPTIRTGPPPSWKPIDRGIKRLSTYDWAIFTSVNGVRYFFERLTKLGYDLRELKGVKICAIGPRTTRAIKELNIRVDLTPKVFRAEAILKALGKRGIKGKKFILPRALVAREILPETIRELGGTIDVLPAYRTVRPRKKAAEIREKIFAGEIDAITFTSSSTVTNFMRFFKKHEAKKINSLTRIACIGPITGDTAKKLGLNVDIMPESYTIPDLTEAIAEYYKKTKL